MKKQVRKGVFETNSSSTHAICISKTNVDKSELPKSVYFGHGQFGWECEIHKDAYDRAAYLNEAIHACFNEQKVKEKQEEIADILSKYNITAEFAKDEMWGKYYHGGFIDHGYETERFLSAVLEDEQKLLNYLFGDSMVVTGNDNGEWFGEYMYNEDTSYEGTYQAKFLNYDIYEKGN